MVPSKAPNGVLWLARHAFFNIGTKETARSLWMIEHLVNWARGLANSQMRFTRENTFTVIRSDGGTHLLTINPNEMRDKYLQEMRADGAEVHLSTDAEFAHSIIPLSEHLHKALTLTFKNAEEAHQAIDPHIDESILPFEFNELFFSLALWHIDVCLQKLENGEWTAGAAESFAEASSACAIGVGDISWGVVYDNAIEMATSRAGRSRWSRLDRAKELAFKRRKEFASLSRSAAIDKFLPEVVEACRVDGEPLTGGDPKRTVTDWFRKAGIK